MNNLEKVLNALKENKKENINYSIPDLWFLEGLDIDFKRIPTNEILLNPYDFYIALIEKYIFSNKKNDLNYSQSLSKTLNNKSTNGDWIKKSVLYSMMVRTSTSYDNDRSYSLDLKNISGLKETGTFVKTLALLPLLKRLGVNVLYLLPLSKYSLKNKKGELGSPYGVESFFKLDPLLKDDLTREKTTLDEEFGALVEACHILGIRVTIDIIPRTSSVCSELIMEHPDWFYWIKKENLESYKSPHIEGIGETEYPSIDKMEKVYTSVNAINHIKLFEKNPKEYDSIKFNMINASSTIEFLEEIEKEFGLIVAPAFSDNINDPQPPWSDITFLRMYLDDPVETKDFLNIDHNPYILFDTIKTNMYHGLKPNKPLWNLLSSIIPYYQENFGIDGARIDMGHALPKELLKMIMDKAKENDNDFSFIAEELNMGMDEVSKEKGYNAYIGNGFWALPRTLEGEFKYFCTHSKDKAIPPFAAVETHDTRRAAKRYGGNKFSLFMTVLNYFIPNTIPFINSGQEIYEKEPMNIGLDSDKTDLEALDKNDIFYGKLALFDKYAFHYTNSNSHEIINHLVDVIKVRNKWIDEMTSKDSLLDAPFYNDNKFLVSFLYHNKKDKKSLLILGNANMDNGENVSVSLSELKKIVDISTVQAKLLYATYEMPRYFNDFNDSLDISCYIGPGEVKIIEL